MRVSEIMVREVASCAPQTSLEDIAMVMWNNDCGAVPLVDEQGHPVGIITDRDIAIRAAREHRPLWKIRGEELVQGRWLHCVHFDDSITHALELMEQRKVRRLPVINRLDELCGMVSMGDIVSFTRAARVRKGGRDQISAADTIGFIKHVSGHHGSRAVTMAS